jgi:hypothetical protein
LSLVAFTGGLFLLLFLPSLDILDLVQIIHFLMVFLTGTDDGGYTRYNSEHKTDDDKRCNYRRHMVHGISLLNWRIRPPSLSCSGDGYKVCSPGS